MLTKEQKIKKISTFLKKKSHINYLTIMLESYNNKDMYIRFDYVEKIKAYKMIWYDLEFVDIKHLELYTNMQLVQSFFANRLVELLHKITIKPGAFIDEKILGDRVTFTINISKDNPKEYVYDRFLPLKWAQLIDPLALVFSYLPRAMENYLSEMFAIFDNNVNYYNSSRPIKLNFAKDNIDDLFDKKIIIKGRRIEDRVTFLEKIGNRYLAIVEDEKIICVIIDKVVNDFYNMWCTCNKPYLDEHIYATLQCIKDNKIRKFYKVKRKSDGKNLLEDVRKGEFYYAFGVEDERIKVVSRDGCIYKIPIKEKGKLAFEVIEDDDNLSLSKILDDFK